MVEQNQRRKRTLAERMGVKGEPEIPNYNARELAKHYFKGNPVYPNNNVFEVSRIIKAFNKSTKKIGWLVNGYEEGEIYTPRYAFIVNEKNILDDTYNISSDI